MLECNARKATVALHLIRGFNRFFLQDGSSMQWKKRTYCPTTGQVF